jgi:hypothetical protein
VESEKDHAPGWPGHKHKDYLKTNEKPKAKTVEEVT